jgi:hypothetical protein
VATAGGVRLARSFRNRWAVGIGVVSLGTFTAATASLAIQGAGVAEKLIYAALASIHRSA